jgi:hypothetical protein
MAFHIGSLCKAEPGNQKIRYRYVTDTQCFGIRILGAKPIRIHADPDPDPGHSLPSQKVRFSNSDFL